MAAVGLALAITAVALGTVPVVGVMALIPASIGFVFSVVALVQARKTHIGKWIAIPGIVLSVAAACWVPIASTLIPMAIDSVAHVSLAAAPPADAPRTDTADSTPPRPIQTVVPPPARNDGYSPPAMRRQPPASPTPGTIASVDTSAIQKRHDLETRLAEFSKTAGAAGDWPETVSALRAEINAMDDDAAKQKLHRTLDDAVMAMVEADAAASLASAADAQNAGALAEAVRTLDALEQRVRKGGTTVTYATPMTPSVAAVSEFQSRLAMLQDPVRRFTPRGTVGGAHGIRVTLHDELTGENLVVEAGAALEGGFTVVSIDEQTRDVKLSRGGRQYRLHW